MRIGLYLHIPFCQRLCTYCDFAKTANFDDSLTQRYFVVLGALMKRALERLACLSKGLSITSVNFGGGTPSLFSAAYEPLFESFEAYLARGAEISLEANPVDITQDRLLKWQELGFNRISLGVQSFDDRALSLFGRDHSPEMARFALELCHGIFSNLNVDLIYGWPGQKAPMWLDEVATVAELVTHLSLYGLTYARGTPLGRAAHRGRFAPMPEDDEATLFESVCRFLDKGWQHDEVSNWSKPGYACRHNWLYWQHGHYLGLGLGAHGFLPELGDRDGKLGVRYALAGQEVRHWIRAMEERLSITGEGAWDTRGLVAELGGIIEEPRTAQSVATEIVAASLRSSQGVDLKRLETITGYKLCLEKNLVVKKAFDAGHLFLKDESRLCLNSSQWYREHAWCREVLETLEG